MILPDVNVLVHAFRADSSDHAECRSWLQLVVNGDSRYAMSPQVLSGVVRVTTHPKVFRRPSTLDEAIGFCEVLLSQPHCVVIQSGEAHWEIFARLCREADARGKPRSGRLVRRAGDRVWLRVGHHGPRLRPLFRLALATAGVAWARLPE